MIHVERTTKPQSLVDHAVIWKQQYIDARMAEDSNPCLENPEDHLEFVFEEDAMHPDGFIAVVRGKTEKGKTTISILGLNRPNLMADRNDLLFPYYIKLAEEAKNGDVKSIKLLRRACESKSVFAAFARSLWK